MTGSELQRDVQRAGGLARALDTILVIPGTRIRFGLDALIGLIPGAGDVITTTMGLYPVVLALRHRLPRHVLLRMLLNLGVDAVFGAVPLIGDLFDVAFKANVRNQRLLERYATAPARTARESAGVLAGIAIAGGVLLAGLLLLVFWALSQGFDALLG